MRKWPHEVSTYTTVEVKLWCVNDFYWQQHRLAMKGLPTDKKLDWLADWVLENGHNRRTEVQVSNYINALKRGGQLDMDLNVVG